MYCFDKWVSAGSESVRQGAFDSHLHYSRQRRDLCADSKNRIHCNGG